MTLLTQAVMVQANIDVERMSAQQKVGPTKSHAAAETAGIHPFVARYGADMLQLEMRIHILLVAFQAMNYEHPLPTISEAVQETCLRRLTSR